MGPIRILTDGQMDGQMERWINSGWTDHIKKVLQS